MGCFDYECECGGNSCAHVGGQLHGARVIIEVPLSDGTVVYLKGYYEEYGYVLVKLPIAEDAGYVEYKFYPKQFEDYFHGWFDGESEEELRMGFLANKIWTFSETAWTLDKYGDEVQGKVKRHCFDEIDASVDDLTHDIVKKCIRADKGLVIKTKEQAQWDRIEALKKEVEYLQKQLGRTNRP